jgi:hypothetical protein
MAIITHYLELIRDYILRMKHFTNIGIEDSNNKEGKYLNSGNTESASSAASESSSFSENNSAENQKEKTEDEVKNPKPVLTNTEPESIFGNTQVSPRDN